MKKTWAIGSFAVLVGALGFTAACSSSNSSGSSGSSSGGSTGTSGGDACEAAASKYQSCGLGTTTSTVATSASSGTVSCTGEVECAANCVANASCTDLKNTTDTSSSYYKCLTACVSATTGSMSTGSQTTTSGNPTSSTSGNPTTTSGNPTSTGSSTGGSGAGGGTPCDTAGATCGDQGPNDCEVCAIQGACNSDAQTCASDPDCGIPSMQGASPTGFYACLQNCDTMYCGSDMCAQMSEQQADDNCIEGAMNSSSCTAQFPTGSMEYLNVLSCIICQQCPTACDAASQCM